MLPSITKKEYLFTDLRHIGHSSFLLSQSWAQSSQNECLHCITTDIGLNKQMPHRFISASSSIVGTSLPARRAFCFIDSVCRYRNSLLIYFSSSKVYSKSSEASKKRKAVFQIMSSGSSRPVSS